MYGNLGVVLISLGEYDKAKEYLAEKALVTKKRLVTNREKPPRTESEELCFSLLVNMTKRKSIF